MNTGGKIILFLGIASAVLFAASALAGISTHKKVREYHLERLNTVHKQTGKDWESVRSFLESENYTLTEDTDGTWLVSWDNPAEQRKIQSERLGVPVNARIWIDKERKTVSQIEGSSW